MKSDINKHIIAGFFLSLGFISLIIILFINPWFLGLNIFSLSNITLLYIKNFDIVLLFITCILFFLSLLIWKRWHIFHAYFSEKILCSIFILYLFLLSEMAFKIFPLGKTNYLLERSVSYLPSPYSQHRLQRNQDIISTENSFGKDNLEKIIIRNAHRGEELKSTKLFDEIRIAFFGGSFVYDMNAMKGKDWVHLAEKKLHNRGYKNVRLINAGVPGYTTADVNGVLSTDTYNLKLDYTILCSSINDITYFNRISPDSTLIQCMTPLVQPTHKLPNPFIPQLYLRIKSLFKNNNPDAKYIYYDTFSNYGPNQFALGVRTFVDISRNIGAEPILFTQPRLISITNSTNIKNKALYKRNRLTHAGQIKAFEECDSILKVVSSEKKTKFFNFSKDITGNNNYFTDFVHTNSIGSEMLAEIASQYVINYIFNKNYSN